MAIVSCEEITGRDRNINALAGFKREYTRRWVLESDTAFEDPVQISTYTDLPFLGASYPTDERAYVINKRVVQGGTEAERKKWIAEVKYSTLDRESQKRLQHHPFERPTEIAWSVRHFQRAIWKDINDEAILNSAGQYFDPSVMIDDSRPVLTVVRAEASFNGSAVAPYVNAINSDPFLGVPQYTVKCVDIRSQRVIEEFANNGVDIQVEYWLVTYEFEYRHETWWLEILDQGRYKKVSGKHVPIPEYDSNGNEIPDSHVADPVPLDGSGGVLSNPTPATAVFLTKRVYRELAFSAFNF